MKFVWAGGLGRARMFSSARQVCAMTDLGPAPGSTRQQNRVGRGPGSGRGKTAGRGQKGQKARHSVKPWFEGGQTPITKLFPKVGFRSALPRPAGINLGRIQQLIDAGRLDASRPITMRELYRTGALGNVSDGVKILARGALQLKTPIKLSASKATSYAIKRVEELGGSFTAQYYSRLGFRALTRPEATLRKYARLPLRARPTDRRNIEYYRSEKYRGYMVGAPGAPQVKAPFKRTSGTVSSLASCLAALEQNDPSRRVIKGFEHSTPAQLEQKV